MPVSSFLVFAAAYLAVVALPGPGVTALVTRVLGRGTEGVAAYIAGFVVGCLAWFTVAAAGLAAVASHFAPVFTGIRILSAGYLLFLAWKLWNAPTRATAGQDASPDGGLRLFLAGLAVNLGNPKAIVFFLALLPTVVPMDRLSIVGLTEMACMIVVIVTTVFTAYTAAAFRARRLFTSAGALRLVNRSSGVVLASAAVATVIR